MFRNRNMFGLRFIALIVLIAAAFCFSVHAQQRRPRSDMKIEWQFDIRDGEYAPEGKVYLFVGTRKIVILPAATEYYDIIERKDYKRNEIPPSALTAIFGWWAGQGKTLYVARRKNSLIVFIKYADEGAPIFHFKRLKTIPLLP